MNARGQIIALTLSAVAVGGAAPAAGRAAAADAEPSSPSVALLQCSHGKRPSDRWAAFNGLMSQMPGAARMRMRFTLQQRVGHGAWRAIAAPGLGVWHESRPGVVRFAYLQRIVALRRGAAYRVRVGFEWHGADGEQLAHERQFSPTCRQPGKLPNLVVKGVPVSRPGANPGTARYSVTVANSGRAVAPRSTILLRVDGGEVDRRPIGPLEPGKRRTIHFPGPACTRVVEVVADPDDTVLEVSEQDNALAVTCPEPR